MTRARASQASSATFMVVACLLAVLQFCIIEAGAQQLAARRYGLRDGLASNRVAAIYQDTKGYLWFGTGDGLSRYDGYRFVNYGQRDGLEQPFINSVIADRQGRIWVSTWGSGVARQAEDPQEKSAGPPNPSDNKQTRKFITYRVGKDRGGNEITSMLFDRDGALWCVTGEGVYRAPYSEQGAPQFELVLPDKMEAAVADSRGRLWFMSQKELIEIAQGKVSRHELVGGFRFPVAKLVESTDGRLLVVDAANVFEFTPANDGPAGKWRRLPINFAPNDKIWTAAIDSQGTLWIGTSEKLIKYRAGQQTDYSNAQLLNRAPIIALHEDREGNLWIGTAQGNTGTGLICKFPGEMIGSFTEADGLPTAYITKVVESLEGRIYASTRDKGFVEIVDGKVVPVPGSQVSPFNNAGKRFLQDARGDWWVGNDVGLYRFEGPELQFRRGAKLTAADGIPELGIVSGPGMYEDSERKIWVSTSDGLYVYDPQDNRKPSFKRVLPKESSSGITGPVLAMHKDNNGALWLGAYSGLGLLTDGRHEFLPLSDGLPDTQARAFYQDSRGRLWIGLRYKGVSVTDDLAARPLRFKNFSTANGLSGDVVGSITEDEQGYIYVGTNRGLDQIDPATGHVRQFTTAEGLAGDEIINCYRDRQGNIWIAAVGGLSRLNARLEEGLAKRPPPIYLSRIQVAGEDWPLPETGALRLPALKLAASQNNLAVEFLGLSFQAGRRLRYQYKLEGVDADWSAPVEQRAVNFARLAPGSYRFVVQAVDQYGVTSREPAVLEFHIAPPIWQRWWFIASVLLLVSVAGYLLYRYRIARLLELERVRTRIATDLHDDIGSNLSRIAILSEVASRQITGGDERVKEPLSTIATTSRELVDSMSDIVWATNPAKDQLSDLTQRMRRFASDVFTARDIEFSFRTPGDEAPVKVGAEVRRQVFLIFKEAINNVVRHAGCTEVDVEMRIEGGHLTLVLRDNGRGFDAAKANGGHGLESMRARAASIGASLDIIPAEGMGTIVVLRAPLVAAFKRGASRVR